MSTTIPLTPTQPHTGAVIDRPAQLSRMTAPGWLDDIRSAIRAREPHLLVDNEWVPASTGDSHVDLDPSSGEPIGSYAVAGEDDVDRSVRAAHAAWRGWAALTLAERSRCVRRLAELIEQNIALFATVDAVDAGLPIARMLDDMQAVLRSLESWPGLALSLRGDVMEGVPGLHYTRYSPYGVVARVMAFNHPILYAVKGSLAPLLAGNTLVLKPSDQTPMSALFLGDLVRQAFPPGVVTILTGDGRTGAALVSHPLVSRVGFTGSLATGRLVQEAAGRGRLRHVSLEMGGKNAMIVYPDVDVQAAARNAVFGMNLRTNQGQSCGSTSRIFVHRDVYEEFTSLLAAELSAMTLGRAYDPDVDMGPVISAQAADRIRGYITAGADEGATLVSGGVDDPRTPESGFFVAPTLFSDVPLDSRIANEEIFGPVISLIPWDDQEAVVDVVNSSSFGLAASIWTRDLQTALTMVDRLEVGYVWVNESTTHYFGTPFGGWKDSGAGNTESIEEFRSYLRLKAVHVKL